MYQFEARKSEINLLVKCKSDIWQLEKLFIGFNRKNVRQKFVVAQMSWHQKNRFEEAATSGDRSVIQNFFCQKTVFDEKEIKIFELRFFMVGCSLVSMLNNHFIRCQIKPRRCRSVSRASERSQSGATPQTWVRMPKWTCHFARVIRF